MIKDKSLLLSDEIPETFTDQDKQEGVTLYFNTDDGYPIPATRYQVRFANGEFRQGRLDREGKVVLKNVPPNMDYYYQYPDDDDILAKANAQRLHRAIETIKSDGIIGYLTYSKSIVERTIDVYNEIYGKDMVKDIYQALGPYHRDRKAIDYLFAKANIKINEYKITINNENIQNYRIIARPNLTNVIRGKVMSFSLQRINLNVPSLVNIGVSWFCYYHINKRSHDKYRGKVISGPRNTTEWHDAKWDVEGQHVVVCEIRYSDNIEYIEYIQNVISAEETVSYSSLTIEESENPFIFYKNLTKQIDWIREQGKQQQLSIDDEKAYQERMKTMEQFKEKLKFLLEKIPTDCRENFGQMHVKHISSIYNDSEDMSLRVGYFYDDKQVYIVDWTNPLDRIYCGVYLGNDENREEAVQQAIVCWDRYNRYPEGVIRGYAAVVKSSCVAKEVTFDENQIIFGKDILFGGIEINFDTDGKSELDTLASIGLAMAIVAGVITVVLPIPGSRIVSGLIWSSIADSTRSAVINIADRHRDGFGNWKDDSSDILTIASNIFPASTQVDGTKWTCKTLSLVNISQKQAAKITLIGKITSDSMQGVLVTDELAEAIYSVISNKELPADVKLSQISSLMTRGLIDDVLVTVNLRGNANHLGALRNITTPPKMMKQKEVNQYISGEKTFSKVKIESSLAEAPSETANSKNEPSQMQNKDKVSHNILPVPPNTVSNIVEKIKNITPYTKELYTRKVINAKITDDNGSSKSFSAILPPEWQLAYMENRVKALSGNYFEKIFNSNLEIGKKRLLLKATNGKISDVNE